MLDAAMLDANPRRGETSSPIAACLEERGVPLLFSIAFMKLGEDRATRIDCVWRRQFTSAICCEV
jgi:hypothetical protein